MIQREYNTLWREIQGEVGGKDKGGGIPPPYANTFYWGRDDPDQGENGILPTYLCDPQAGRSCALRDR